MSWRNRDHAPVGQTCPMIDGVLSAINDLYRSSEEMSKGELQYFEATLEKIRSHNGALRDWGNEMCIKAHDFESEKEELERVVEKLQDEIENYKEEIKQYAS